MSGLLSRATALADACRPKAWLALRCSCTPTRPGSRPVYNTRKASLSYRSTDTHACLR